MVACDDTRHMVFPQPALHSDLAHLGEGPNLPDYLLCALLFVSDTVPGDAFLMTPVLPLDVAGRALHAARALVVKRHRGIVDRRASTLPCGGLAVLRYPAVLRFPECSVNWRQTLGHCGTGSNTSGWCRGTIGLPDKSPETQR